MTDSKPDDLMASFRTVAETGAMRSRLGRWFVANRDEFDQMMRTYRPRWEVIIEKLVSEKLMEVDPDFFSEDDHLRRPVRRKAVEAVRKIWQRAKAKKTVRRKPKPTAPIINDPGPDDEPDNPPFHFPFVKER